MQSFSANQTSCDLNPQKSKSFSVAVQGSVKAKAKGREENFEDYRIQKNLYLCEEF